LSKGMIMLLFIIVSVMCFTPLVCYLQRHLWKGGR
jgi:hypothetical protein